MAPAKKGPEDGGWRPRLRRRAAGQGTLGGSRMRRLVRRQDERATMKETVEAAERAAEKAAEAAKAAQAAGWQNWWLQAGSYHMWPQTGVE